MHFLLVVQKQPHQSEIIRNEATNHNFPNKTCLFLSNTNCYYHPINDLFSIRYIVLSKCCKLYPEDRPTFDDLVTQMVRKL